MYGGSDAQVNYRLGLVQHGCDSDAQMGYHTDARERPLMWIGEGLDAFGVEGLTAGAELTSEQHELARNLIRGQHPTTGEQLVTPKVAVAAEAKVSLGPLVAAVEEMATARGVAAAELFAGNLAAGRAWEAATRGVSRRGGRAVARVDEATHLAGVAGVDPGEVWGAKRVNEATAALWDVRVVRDADGKAVLREDGTEKVEQVARRERVGIAGYDIGINVPKSMSVLLAMAPDEMAGRIENIYAQAASRTFGWTEARTSYIKRGKHGDGHVARQEKSSGMAGWVMTHRTARPVGDLPIGDPHWHVHITVANMARAADGTWLTIASGGRDLMRHAPSVDKITQALVRHELHREFGITFARSARTGVWEVEHIPTEANDLFSKRGQQVNEALAKLGYGPGQVSPKESRVLTRACRSGKSEATAAADVTLREYWRAQAIAAGYDPANWMPRVLAGYQAGQTTPSQASERANETMTARYGISLDEVVAQLSHPERGLTAHTRRFSHVDAIAAVADALPYLRSETEIVALTDLVLAHPAFVVLPDKTGEHAALAGAGTQLAGSHDMAGGQLYTTQGVIDAEQIIMDRVQAASSETDYATVAPDILELAIGVAEAQQGYELSEEQRAAVAATVTSGAGIGAIEGPAGTGKTTMMRAARIAYESAGYTVGGAATAAVAAQGLAAESGIPSRTVAQWKRAIEAEGGPRGIDVLVLDEANLTDDADRAALWEAGRQTHTAIREVGDPKQLRAPGSGSSFGYIHTALNGPRLTDNRRQRDEDARRAVAAWRDGRYVESLRGWDARGGVVATQTGDDAVAAMVYRWMRAAEGAPDPHTRAAGLLAVAATNEQVTRLNQAIQGARQARGELGESHSYAMPAGRAIVFHLGDQVVLRTNDRFGKLTTGEGVLNGYRGVVTGVSARGVEVEWREPADQPGQAPHSGEMSPQYIAEGGMDLGYCLTGYKAEGMTIKAEWDRADGSRNRGTTLVWGPGMDAAGGYVKTSRAAGDTVIVAPLEELEGERERLLYGTPSDQQELTERAIAAIAAKAEATADNADDRPVLVDLGQAPSVEDWRLYHDGQATTAQPAPAQAEPEPVTDSEPSVQHGPEQDAQVADVDADPVDVGEQVGARPEIEPSGEQWEHYLDLDREVRAAEESCDESALREAFEQRQAYERDVLGKAGRYYLAQTGTWEQYSEQRAVTDEQRERWRELSRRYAATFRRDATESSKAVKAEKAAFRDELGPERAYRLQRETTLELARRNAERAQRADARRAEQERAAAEQKAVAEVRQRWLARPHGKLTDQQIEQAIATAERDRAKNLAEAERARQQHAGAEPAVLAGQGPRVTDLYTSLAERRRVLGVHDAAVKVNEGRLSAERTAWGFSRQAMEKEQQAQATSRLRPRSRERLLAEAAELRQSHREWMAHAGELQRRIDGLREQGWSGYADNTRPRQQVEQAEATYPQDREQAHQLDVRELDATRQRIGSREGDAGTAAAKAAALAGERQQRDDMPDDQRTVEHGLRTKWHEEQQRIADEKEAERVERQAEYFRTYQPPTLDHGQSRNRGMGFGL
jgi:conjugative relaxase-like TrwC/TraI family protein